MNRPSGQRRVLWVVVIAVVTVAAIVAGIALSTRDSSRTVPVVGDSITYLAAHDISTALQSGEYRPNIKAGVGQRIDQMLRILRDVLRADPFAVVVNLGTNDVLQAETHRDWQSGFRRMVALLGSQRCVELTTISTIVDEAAGTPVAASQINGAIAAAVSDHPNFHVVDWDAAVHRSNGATLLNSDRIHPSPAGRAVLGALTRAALDRDCRDA